MGFRRPDLAAFGIHHVLVQRVVESYSVDRFFSQPRCGIPALPDPAAGARQQYRTDRRRFGACARGPGAARCGSLGCAGDVPRSGFAWYHVAAVNGYRSHCGISRRHCDGARRCSPHGDIAI